MIPKSEPEHPLFDSKLVKDCHGVRHEEQQNLRGCKTVDGVISTQDEPPDSAREIHERKANRTDRFLHITCQEHLKQKISNDMDEAGVQEDRRDEAIPLVWGRKLVQITTLLISIRHPAQTAKLR